MRAICGLETTIKGRFRRARRRWARRCGRRERVKFADARRAEVESGGRPCLFEVDISWWTWQGRLCEGEKRAKRELKEILLYQVGENQWLEGFAGQTVDLLIGDWSRGGEVRPPPICLGRFGDCGEGPRSELRRAQLAKKARLEYDRPLCHCFRH